MPRMNGIEMLQRVRERHGVETIPVVMFSGKVEAEEEAQEAGAQAFIGKPFDPAHLLASTRQLLRSRP
jgi:twitching motility two-component system response regulator PilH